MSELSEFLLSSPPAAVRFQVLEITHPNFSTTYRLVRNATGGVYVRHENQQFPTFYQYLPMKLEEIGSDNSIDQELQVTVGDLGELIPIEIELVEADNAMHIKPELVYREYSSQDVLIQGVEGGDWIFDGANDTVSMGDTFQQEINDSFSITGWFDTSSSADMTLISKATGPAGIGWTVLMASGQLVFNCNGTGTLNIRTNLTYNDGDLHMFAITKTTATTASGVIIYIDGDPVATTTSLDTLSGTMLNAAFLSIGTINGTNLPFDGQLTHFTLWDTVISADQVEAFYNNGTPPNIFEATTAEAIELTLEGWWRLDYSDTTAASGIVDHSPIARHGTAAGGLAPVGVISAPVFQSPIFGPATLQITGINFDNHGATFTASPKLANRTRTGIYYIPEKFPMLEGFL